MSFKPYKSDRSDFNAGNIAVIEVPDKKSNNAPNKNNTKKRISFVRTFWERKIKGK